MRFSAQQLGDAIQAQEPQMLRLLADFFACPSFSGREETAIAFLEPVLQGMGLAPERIALDSAALRGAPLYSPACDPDNGRCNLLAEHSPRQALPNRLRVKFDYRGFQAPGCEFDLEHPAMRALAGAHAAINGAPPRRLAMTATTDARHFHFLAKLPVTCYGPQAGNIHGVDEWVSIASMRRVATVMAQFIQDWCGLEAV